MDSNHLELNCWNLANVSQWAGGLEVTCIIGTAFRD